MTHPVYSVLVLLAFMGVAAGQDLGLNPPAVPATLGSGTSIENGPALDVGPSPADNGPGSGLTVRPAPPTPFYNLLSAPEEPGGGAFIGVKSSSPDVGLLVYGRVSIDTVTSNGRLLAPFGYIFLGPRTPEGQWTNVISARQSTLGFLFTGPDLGSFKTLARFETYFLSSVTDANVYGLAQYYLYAKLINDDWARSPGA